MLLPAAAQGFENINPRRTDLLFCQRHLQSRVDHGVLGHEYIEVTYGPGLIALLGHMEGVFGMRLRFGQCVALVDGPRISAQGLLRFLERSQHHAIKSRKRRRALRLALGNAAARLVMLGNDQVIRGPNENDHV